MLILQRVRGRGRSGNFYDQAERKRFHCRGRSGVRREYYWGEIFTQRGVCGGGVGKSESGNRGGGILVTREEKEYLSKG